MAENEPVLVRVNDHHEVSLVEDSERGRELLVHFMQNNMLMLTNFLKFVIVVCGLTALFLKYGL